MLDKTSPYLLMTISLFCADVFADVPAAQQNEVTHLLEFVETSACIVDRNGSRHTGKEAVDHIRKKYDYFRDRIRNTEEFIEYSAAKSTVSGKPYRVVCADGVTTTTKEWLLEELRRYRARR